jgi:nucleoside-diphosphate-sugar epimerase
MVAGSDAVIHLVAYSAGWRAAGDAASEQVNVGVMRHLVEALRARGGYRPVPVVVFAGSSSQVGSSARMPIDGTEPDRPETTYDRQKQAAEDALKAATAQGALRGVSLRLPTVYGLGPASAAGGEPGVLAAMIGRALAGAPLTMWHDGTVQRDLLHVDDVAAAFVAALDHGEALAGRHWPLGTGRGERLGDVFRTIAQLVSDHTGAAPVPVVSVPPPADSTATDLRSVVVNCSAFRSATGWRPEVRLGEALRRMVVELAARRDGPGTGAP